MLTFNYIVGAISVKVVKSLQRCSDGWEMSTRVALSGAMEAVRFDREINNREMMNGFSQCMGAYGRVL